MLLKYRFSAGKYQPFAAAGPSFRTSSTLIQTRPSSHGVTAEMGVEIPAGRLRLGPSIRFTHWGGDGALFAPTVRNQIEALIEVRYRREPTLQQAFEKKIWFGLMAGVPLTHDFAKQSVTGPYTGQATRTMDFRSAAGLTAEVELARGMSVEVNGLYRRLHYQSGPEVVVTWEIPVLAKYTFNVAPVRPFVEAGPSFRLTGNLNDAEPAHYGTTAGVGIEMRWKRLRITPSLRYTRWGADGQPLNASASVTKRDQTELLVGFSF